MTFTPAVWQRMFSQTRTSRLSQDSHFKSPRSSTSKVRRTHSLTHTGTSLPRVLTNETMINCMVRGCVCGWHLSGHPKLMSKEPMTRFMRRIKVFSREGLASVSSILCGYFSTPPATQTLLFVKQKEIFSFSLMRTEKYKDINPVDVFRRLT